MNAAIESVNSEQDTATALYPRESPCTKFTVSWLCHAAGQDEGKISYTTGIDPGSSSPQSVAIQNELPAHIGSVYWDLFWELYQRQRDISH